MGLVWSGVVHADGFYDGQFGLDFFGQGSANIRVSEPTTFNTTVSAEGLNFSVSLTLNSGELKGDRFTVNEGTTATLTITAPANYDLTWVELQYESSRKWFGSITSDPVTTGEDGSSPTADPYQWDGTDDDVNSVTFTINANQGHDARVKFISFYYQRSTNSAPLAPVLAPPGGTYTAPQTVFISNAEDGVTYYVNKSHHHENNEDYGQTTDNNWLPYVAKDGINVDSTMTLNVVGVGSNGMLSDYTHQRYDINAIAKAATPTFSLSSGTYYGTQNLTISDETENVGIFYYLSKEPLTNLTVNDTVWEVYTQPLIITDDTYVYAYANGDDVDASDISSVHLDIEAGSSPGLAWGEQSMDVLLSDSTTWKANTLTNPNNVPVVFSITGTNASKVATIDPITGAIQIWGVGTVIVWATYTAPSSSKYNSQAVSYTLTVTDNSTKSVTFYTGPSVDDGYVIATEKEATSTINSVDVPNGVVIKLDIKGYPANAIVMVGVADRTGSNNPYYQTKKDGSLDVDEQLDDDGHVAKTADGKDNSISTIEYVGNGIPIYYSDFANHQVYLKVRLYDPNNKKKSLGQHIILLNVSNDSIQPARPTAVPATFGNAGETHTVLTPSQAVTINGEEGSTVYAKFSSGTTYTPRLLLGEDNLATGTTTTPLYSSEYHPDRRVSAIQVKHKVTWNGHQYDIASDLLVVYYTYTPNRHTVRLESVNNPVYLVLSGNNKKLTDTLQVNSYIDDVRQNLPERINGGKPNYVSSNTLVATVDANGVVTARGAGSAIITVSTPRVDATIKQIKNDQYAADEEGYDAASEAFNVFVSDPQSQKLLPPVFSPSVNTTYHANSRVTVVANSQAEDGDTLSVGKAFYVLVDDSAKSDDVTRDFIMEVVNNNDTSVVSAYGIVNVGSTVNVNIPVVHKRDGKPMADGDTYTIYGVTYNPYNNNKYSDPIAVTFTYKRLVVDAPVLTPGMEGDFGDESKLYSFVGDSLIVSASSTTPLAMIYYTRNSASQSVDMTNGLLYSGDTRIRLGESTIVRAVAYYDGVYSDVVTYSYRKATPNIQRPIFRVNNNDHYAGGAFVNRDGAVMTEDKRAVIRLRCLADVNQDGVYADVVNNPDYRIYYTTDGTPPTSRSNVYTDSLVFDDDGTFTIWAFCKNIKLGSTGLNSKLLLRIRDGVQVWYASEQTCPGGVLKDHVISKKVQNTNTQYAPSDITITLGREGQEWSNQTVAETYKGNRIDGYGNYDITAKGSDSDAEDELGVLYNHAYAQPNDYSETYKAAHPDVTVASRAKGVYESTFKLPAHGAFVKFEPEKDGFVTIWCEQNGGMQYSRAVDNADHFYNQFIRKRPAYFVDEQGKTVAYTDVNAAGTLNPEWALIDSTALLGMGGIEDGLPQTLFTKDEAQDIYAMYNAKINNNPADRSIQDLVVALNDGNHQKAAGAGTDMGGDDNVIDGTGYCIPSASYMKYEFPVKAGKTYFFFAVKTKIAISALGFRVDSTAVTNTVTINRTFKKNRWAALVLPFSMSAMKVKETFGEGTIIQHYYGYQDEKPVSYINLAQHDHQMIVAGTPVFILPTLEGVDGVVGDSITSISVDGIQLEKTSVDDVTDQKWGSNVDMTGTLVDGATTPLYGFYVQDGKLVQALHGAVSQKANRGWLQGLSSAAKVRVGYSRGTTTEINSIEEYGSRSLDDNIYNLGGMIVGRGDADFHRLPQGVYIYKGEKIIR